MAEQQVDLKEIYNILRRRSKAIIGTTILSVALACAYIYQAVPQYSAETTIILDTQSKNILEGVAALSGITDDSAAIDSQVEVIRSRNLLKRVADKYNLYDDGEFAEKPGFFNQFGLFVKGLFSESGNNKPLTEKEKKQAEMIHQNDIISQIDDHLFVQRKGQTQALVLSYVSRSPEKARLIVQAIADSYLNEQLEAKLEETKRANVWLEERLKSLRDEMREKQEAIVQYKQAHNLFSAQGATQIEQQVSRLNEQLIIAKGDTAEKLAAYNQVRHLARTGAIQSFSGVLNSNVIASLRDKEAEIARSLADLSSRYGNNHPKLRDAKAQLSDIRGQISQEVNRILAGAKSEYEISRSREASLASSLIGLRSEFKNTGVHGSRLEQLEREAEAAKTAFDAVSERFKRTDKSDEVQKSDARIISHAVVPTNPIFPKKSLVLFMATIGGLIIGFGLAFLREHLVSGFMSSEMVEKSLGINVITTIHEMSPVQMKAEAKTDKLHKYVYNKPISLFSEAIRKIRVAVEVDHYKGNIGQVVLVTSSVPNEGKTQISASIAASWANAGQRALIIDCDLRNPSMESTLGAKVQKGIYEFLSGKANFEDIIIRDVDKNIDFIGIKGRSDSPSDLFSLPRFGELMSHLRQIYPLIILDTPPLAPVIDTAVIANHADNIVYVTAWEKTPRKIVVSSLKALEHNKDKISGIVLNRVNVKREAHYGNYYGYAMKNYSKYYTS